MKENYKAWSIDLSKFYSCQTIKEQFVFLIQFAVLAPSSHNSQPWKFHIIDDNSILLDTDFSRALPKSDSNHRQLYVSLGCALQNLCIAADYYGFDYSVILFPFFENNKTAAKISLVKKDNKHSVIHHPLLVVPNRRTNRNPYDIQTPDPSFLKWVTQKTSVFSNTEVFFIRDNPLKSNIADVVSDALIVAMDNPEFREELSHYLKPNNTKSFIGMPGYGFGIPLPFSWIAPKLIKYVNINKLSKKKDKSLLVNSTPLFIIIGTKDDTPREWIQTGQLFQTIAIGAEEFHLHTHMMAAAIQIEDFYKKLQKLLNTTLRPQAFFRIGYSKKIPRPNPRLTASMICESE